MEQNYKVFDRELLGIIRALHHWSHLLRSTVLPVLIWTDHQNLTYCRDSLLYKGSEDNNGLELEVTGWAWNKRTKTRMMMTAMRIRAKGSMIAVRLRLWEVDKRTV